MDPPPAPAGCCATRGRPRQREGSQEYLWANDTPLAIPDRDTNNIYRFTPHIESLTRRFAERAIIAQPLDYARVVAEDTLTTSAGRG